MFANALDTHGSLGVYALNPSKSSSTVRRGSVLAYDKPARNTLFSHSQGHFNPFKSGAFKCPAHMEIPWYYCRLTRNIWLIFSCRVDHLSPTVFECFSIWCALLKDAIPCVYCRCKWVNLLIRQINLTFWLEIFFSYVHQLEYSRKIVHTYKHQWIFNQY